MKIYRNAFEGDSEVYDSDTIDSSVVLGEYAAANAIFDSYKAATETFTADLKKYNDAVKARNDALTAEEPPEEEGKPDPLPAKPSPPVAPDAWTGLALNIAETFTVNATNLPGTGMAIARRQQNANTAEASVWCDSRRVGYQFVYPDDSAAADARTLVTTGVGQVFGRFGPYDSTLKGARWANAADTAAYDNYL